MDNKEEMMQSPKTVKHCLLTASVFLILFAIFTFQASAHKAITSTADSNEIAARQMSVSKITEQVYLHRSWQHINGYGWVSSNGLVVIEQHNNQQHAIIIDTPWSDKDTLKLIDWIHEHEFKLMASISTHSHEDRTAGISVLNQQGIPTWASTLTNQLLETAGKTPALNELSGANGQQRFSAITNTNLTVFYPGQGHAEDNLVVWLPKQKLLFGGCLIRSIKSKSAGNTADANLAEWPKSVARTIKAFPNVSMVVPGHGSVGGPELLSHTKALIERVENQRRKKSQ